MAIKISYHSLLVCSLAAASLLGQPDGARADDCAPHDAAASAHGHAAWTVLDTHNLYRRQDRPYMQIPTGVALRVRVAPGTTAADLHRQATQLVGSDAARQAGSAFAVPGVNVRVRRTGQDYVIELTTSTRSDARELQRRAERT